MIPIDFGVTSLKVKVTEALNVKIVSTHYLQKLAQSLHISHIDLSHVGRPHVFH
jgi:hypothetical protein